MSFNLEEFIASRPDLEFEALSENEHRLAITLPKLPKDREIASASLIIPMQFPELSLARIELSKNCILRIPHVESDGRLCTKDGDPGPSSGASPSDRLDQLLDVFYFDFLYPWERGELDNHFAEEAKNYWAIHYNRYLPQNRPVKKIYITDNDRQKAQLYSARLINNKRLVIAGKDAKLAQRLTNSNWPGNPISHVLVAEIPISTPFVPETWPKKDDEVIRLLRYHMEQKEFNKFEPNKNHLKSRHGYRIVIFRCRCPQLDFGFLLSGGKPYIKRGKHATRAYPNTALTPLLTERVDASWTAGRDQHLEVNARQKKQILVVGAGALGSSVIELLAKSGIGSITIVDPDILCTANINRHVLGADSLGKPKAEALAENIQRRWPSCSVYGFSGELSEWLKKHSISTMHTILDLTGEPDVRLLIERARKQQPVDLLIGWMEPFVFAAHACILPKEAKWFRSNVDPLRSLQAVDWPNDIMINEPACSSVFQSYTPTAATYANGLIAEAALNLIDQKIDKAIIKRWVRGQSYLNKHSPSLKMKDWAEEASKADGIMMENDYDPQV